MDDCWWEINFSDTYRPPGLDRRAGRSGGGWDHPIIYSKGSDTDGVLLRCCPRSRAATAANVEGEAAAEKTWVRVTAPGNDAGRPWWSPNGDLLYFVSQADGKTCIWAQLLDSETKAPIGDPTGVYHFHSSLSPRNEEGFKLSVGGNRMVFNLEATRGNVWLAKPQR